MSPWSTVFRQTAVLFLLLGVGLAAVLFTLKHQVQALEKELVELNDNIAEEENAVRVLRAEFDVLTDTERLKRLSARHLDLAPLEPEQMASFSRLRQLLEGHGEYAHNVPLRAAIGSAWGGGGGQ
ncbi:MAG: cell division protein FtsL [Rhodospirillales bacterium]|nr:hypothetical protein [Rhodospirillales bacterium]